ncbi:IS2 repressor TnpA [Raoultella planticola]|uniref:IS2 repressor TnpA n=1 Tax=Raoultella planticola TaxID=575 RepID=A0A485D4G5_RAOPL|nr:IS2 repressor TnpA [Raoultella planticola]
MNVSHVARLHGIQPSLLFKWKKQYQEGSLTAVAAERKSFLLLSLLLL